MCLFYSAYLDWDKPGWYNAAQKGTLQGIAPLDIVRNKNAKNVLFAQGQMVIGRAIERRIGEMARNPDWAVPLIPGSPGIL